MLLQYCENFDKEIPEKIVFYKNLFFKTTKNLQSLRLARRLLKRAELLILFKKYESDKSRENSLECLMYAKQPKIDSYLTSTIQNYNTRQSEFFRKNEKTLKVCQNLQSTVSQKVDIENIDYISMTEDEEELSMLRDIIFIDFVHVIKIIISSENRKVPVANLFKELVQFSSHLTGFNLTGLGCQGCRLCTDCLKIAKSIDSADLIEIFDKMALVIGN